MENNETIQELCDRKSVRAFTDQPFIASAPMVLVFCADCKKWFDCYREADADPRKPGSGDLMIAVTDTAIAAQNAVTAAWSLGIGSCYIGDIMEQYEQQRDILHLPDYVFPAVMAVFGYPTPSQKSRPKPQRFDLEQMVFENTYPEQTDCRGMLKKRCGSQDYETWVQQLCVRKYNSDFAREMNRSVEKYLTQYHR